MKVIVHDWSGHPFTGQLGRALAIKSADVLYVSFGGFQTPKGETTRRAGDPAAFRALELTIPSTFNKDNLIRRGRQQLQYAAKIADLVRREAPDVVISANTPIEVQLVIQLACKRCGAAYVCWLQDINSEAIGRILGRKSKLLGIAAGYYYRLAEARLLRRSDAVVLIADSFRDVLASPPWNLDVSDMSVVENWGVISDGAQLPRNNPWALANMPGTRPRIVYTGTLARKHNPEMLIALARNLEADIYVFSEGSAPEALRRRAQEASLHNLFVRPWVPVEDVPGMLAGADILFALIEPDAGIFSVPSKVLTYLAAGKPILASIPRQNLSARNIVRENAGLVSEPNDEAGLLDNARALLADSTFRERLGGNGRAYAERAFDIDAIAARFEGILRDTVRRRVREQRPDTPTERQSA